MARFYYEVCGQKNNSKPAHRLAHGFRTGLHPSEISGRSAYAIAASFSGAVKTELYTNADGVECARVRLVPWHGAGVNRVLYDGPVNA